MATAEKPILLKVELSDRSDGTQGNGAFWVRIESESGMREEGSSYLPFPMNRRTTLIKALELEAGQFKPSDPTQFDSDEQKWMLSASWLNDDGNGRKSFHPEVLTTIGQAIYEALFPSGKVRDLLKTTLNDARRDSRAVHLQLGLDAKTSASNRLPDYPWELAHDDYGFLAHRGILFSRFIHYSEIPPGVSGVPTLSVLLVSSLAYRSKYQEEAKTEEEQKRQQQEQEQQEQEFRQESEAICETLAAQSNIHLLQTERATLKHLKAALAKQRDDQRLHLLHFHGHGDFGKRCTNDLCRKFSGNLKQTVCDRCGTNLPSAPQGYLLFETEADRFTADYVSAKELGAQLQAYGGVTVAVLSACKSGFSVGNGSVFNGIAQNLISHGVPAVVAMRHNVGVDQAVTFAEAFYSALGQKHSLARAVYIGQVGMGVEGRQWYRPVLYLRWRDNEGGQLFAPEVVPEIAPEQDKPEQAVPGNFGAEMVDLNNALLPGSSARLEMINLISGSSKFKSVDTRRTFFSNSALAAEAASFDLSGSPEEFAERILPILLGIEKLDVFLNWLLSTDKFLPQSKQKFLRSLLGIK